MTQAARQILLGILWLGLAGVSIELLLLGHTEHLDQWIPLLLAGASFAVSMAAAVRPSLGALRLFQLVMVLMIASGFAGMYLHLRGNIEFQLEMDAALQGWALFRKSIVAKSPPAMAPGAMIQLGLIGLAYTFRHPQLVPPKL